MTDSNHAPSDWAYALALREEFNSSRPRTPGEKRLLERIKHRVSELAGVRETISPHAADSRQPIDRVSL